MHELLDAIRGAFAVDTDAEITAECNPESLRPARMAAYAEAGVNRISFGVQSFDDKELSLLDRPHSAALARRRFRRLRRFGFRSLSLDLIYGLPVRESTTWRRTLDAALELEPDHLSAYLLGLEPRVPLARALARDRARAPLPEGDAAREQYESLREAAAAAGLRQYEISNFARPGHESLHNQNYWVRGDYLGLGPSAHSHRGGLRWSNVASMPRWREGVRSGNLPVEEEERITGPAAAAEWIFLGLRRAEGVPWSLIAEAAGAERLSTLEETVRRLRDGGLLAFDGDRLALRSDACFISNAVFTELLEALG